jgi:hypothetical protein
MRTTWPKIAILVVCCIALAFEVWHFRNGSTPGRQSSGPVARKSEPGFALLPATEIQLWSKYFAVGTRPESWEPTLGDMNDVEDGLAQITTLSNIDPDPNRHIDNPRDYDRQYLAVVVNRRKFIYLNALCSVEQNANWRKHLIVIRDGGKCFWQAMYDLSTHRFSDLRVNGSA